MNRMTLIAAGLVSAMAAAATATVAIAAPQATTDAGARTKARTSLDTNKDGVIDRAEAAKAPRMAQKFDQLDKNKDGRLSTDERPMRKGGWRHGKGHGGHGMRGGMEHLDKDADGRISRAEFDAAKVQREQRMAAAGKSARAGKQHAGFDFSAVDGNRDGYLVRSELRSYHERQRPLREAEFAKRSAERFAAADLNKDGKLSRVEVSEKMPRMEKSFAWMDENRDGFLSRQELQPQRRR